MTPDIDTMTPDQLRDALSRATGWDPQPDGTWKHRDSGSTTSGMPMPPLESPIALGLVAGMMPTNWLVEVGNGDRPDYASQRHPDLWYAFGFGDDYERDASGPTETIARARLVLKIRACSKPNSSPARPS